MCCVQRRRSGACFAWGRGFRHCCVAVSKSRGWGADFPWLVYVLWARRGVGWGARTLAPRASVCVCVWALGAPPAVRVAWVTPLRGASEAGRSPSSGCPPPGGCRRPLSTCCGRGCEFVGAQHCPFGLLALWGLRAAGLSGGRLRGEWPATVVRGVWCQALSLPWPLILWGGQPGFRDPGLPCAVGAGVGTERQPHSVRPCGPTLRAVGWRKGVSGGGAFLLCEGRLGSGAPPPPTARPPGRLSGSTIHVLWARVWECGCPALPPWLACLLQAACPRGGGGPSAGGRPAIVVRGVWCQALSLSRPPVP